MISLGDWHGMIGVGQKGSLFGTQGDATKKASYHQNLLCSQQVF
jgi:hypothetical protein